MKFEPVVIGDTTKTLGVQLGGLTNLNSVASIAVHLWHPGFTPVTVAATIISSSERTITFDVAPLLTNAATLPVVYSVEYELTYLSGLKETWPPLPDELPVRAQGA